MADLEYHEKESGLVQLSQEALVGCNSVFNRSFWGEMFTGWVGARSPTVSANWSIWTSILWVFPQRTLLGRWVLC